MTRSSRGAWAVMASLVLLGCEGDATKLPVVGIRAEGCGPTAARASGLVVAPGIVLTSAHPVAGADDIKVWLDADTHAAAAVVGFDPSMDLAYLRTAAVDAVEPTLSSESAERGATGHAVVFRDGQPVALDVEVRRRVRINTEDIYVEGETTRPGFELSADIKLGDSGAAVVIDGEEVIGVLWARTRSFDDDRAYAIDVSRARDLIDEQLASGAIGPGIDLSRCP